MRASDMSKLSRPRFGSKTFLQTMILTKRSTNCLPDSRVFAAHSPSTKSRIVDSLTFRVYHVRIRGRLFGTSLRENSSDQSARLGQIIEFAQTWLICSCQSAHVTENLEVKTFLRFCLYFLNKGTERYLK